MYTVFNVPQFTDTAEQNNKTSVRVYGGNFFEVLENTGTTKQKIT
jgi:hypothetical protein